MDDRIRQLISGNLPTAFSQKGFKEWRDFVVVVLAFIGLWHVMAGTGNVLRMLF